ncbi:MAG: hypothetical protein ACWA40_07585 [Planktomarina sp.]
MPSHRKLLFGLTCALIFIVGTISVIFLNRNLNRVVIYMPHEAEVGDVILRSFAPGPAKFCVHYPYDSDSNEWVAEGSVLLVVNINDLQTSKFSLVQSIVQDTTYGEQWVRPGSIFFQDDVGRCKEFTVPTEYELRVLEVDERRHAKIINMILSHASVGRNLK